jgi:hypothetical protein
MMALVVGVVRVTEAKEGEVVRWTVATEVEEVHLIEAKEGEVVRWIVAAEVEEVHLIEVQEEARLHCLSLVVGE